MDRYRTPILTAREAARHLGMPETTLDRWLKELVAGGPMVHSVTPERRGWPRVPFVGVIEAHVLRTLREAGFSLEEVRRAVGLVRREFGDEYALASRRIASDGVKLFVRMADDRHVDVDGQQPIEEVIEKYLHYITWDDEGRPERLRLATYGSADVIIDPRFSWGVPVLADVKAPVGAMVDLWHAGETMETVAEEFGVPRSVVEDVCRVAA